MQKAAYPDSYLVALLEISTGILLSCLSKDCVCFLPYPFMFIASATTGLQPIG
jgi:hypothetical protein